MKSTTSLRREDLMFCGMVTKVELDEEEVRFMKEVKAAGKVPHYVWPNADDESWVPMSDIVDVLKCPYIDRQDHYVYPE